MGKALTKSQVADYMAKKMDLKKKVAAGFLDELAGLAYREAKNSFTIPGLGKLVLVNRKARIGRNPATGEQIQIPAILASVPPCEHFCDRRSRENHRVAYLAGCSCVKQ